MEETIIGIVKSLGYSFKPEQIDVINQFMFTK